ncbi:MAG: hypothetical protein R3F20_16695 [Planctomycetota bacterium]
MSGATSPEAPRGTPVDARTLATARVQAPSLGLLFFGLLGLLTPIIFLLDPFDRLPRDVSEVEPPAATAPESPGGETGEDGAGAKEGGSTPAEGGQLGDEVPTWLRPILHGLSIIACLVIIVGAWQMRQMKHLKLARIACLLAMLPVQMTFCLSFVFGFWAGVIVLRDDVAEYFES